MNKKQKEETIKVFAEAFHEVVAPEIVEIKERLTNIEGGMDTLNRKFDAQQDRMDRHGKQLENHEKRINHIEEKATFTV